MNWDRLPQMKQIIEESKSEQYFMNKNMGSKREENDNNKNTF